ncbi:MAG: glycosyltransferase [Candidatus Neomarinimicrobiota bacterium]
MNNSITVISTSYFSGEHLSRLFNNLLKKAEHKDSLQFLVIDNTNGSDDTLHDYLLDILHVKIILNDGRNLQRSISHSIALDIGLKVSNSKFTLIIDPDVHIFKEKWDTLCVDFFQNNEKLVVGAPYPDWKLGKVHDYPSVVFIFFRTEQIKEFNKSFYPFPKIFIKIKNSIFRKITRLGFLSSKNRLDRSLFLRKITKRLEKSFGITSPDTGKDIIALCRDRLFKSINFKACYPSMLENERFNSSQYDMAKEFELYFYKEEPFMTHMYGSGVFHWKTINGANKNYWKKLIKKIEKEIK